MEDVSAVKVERGLGSEAPQCLTQAFALAAHKVLDGDGVDLLSSSKGAGRNGRQVSSMSAGTDPSSHGSRSNIQGTSELVASTVYDNGKPGKGTSFEPALEPRSPLLDYSAVIYAEWSVRSNSLV